MIGEATDEEKIVAKLPVQRLCNEIKLFDLCDLERCSFKKERFCTNADLITAFERISDAEVVRSETYISEKLEDGDDDCAGEYDDGFEDDEFGDEAEYND